MMGFFRFSAAATLSLSMALAASTTITVQTLRPNFPATFRLTPLALMQAVFSVQQGSEVAARAGVCPSMVPAFLLLVVIPLLSPFMVSKLGRIRRGYAHRLLRLSMIFAALSAAYWAHTLITGGVSVQTLSHGPTRYALRLPFAGLKVGSLLLRALPVGSDGLLGGVAKSLDDVPSQEFFGALATVSLVIGALVPLYASRLRGMRMIATACVGLTAGGHYLSGQSDAPGIPGFCCGVATVGFMLVANLEMAHQEELRQARKAMKAQKAAGAAAAGSKPAGGAAAVSSSAADKSKPMHKRMH